MLLFNSLVFIKVRINNLRFFIIKSFIQKIMQNINSFISIAYVFSKSLRYK